jgi:hypothetical protein
MLDRTSERVRTSGRSCWPTSRYDGSLKFRVAARYVKMITGSLYNQEPSLGHQGFAIQIRARRLSSDSGNVVGHQEDHHLLAAVSFLLTSHHVFRPVAARRPPRRAPGDEEAIGGVDGVDNGSELQSSPTLTRGFL